MDELQLLRGKDYQITKHLKIHQPTLDEIYEYGEQQYFNMVLTLTAIPSDMKSFLFDIGYDYEQMSDFELFCNLYKSFDVKKTGIIFGNDVDLTSIEPCINKKNEEIVLCKIKENGCMNENHLIINEPVYILMTEYLRQMHGFKKKVEKAGNAFTKQFLIDEDRMNHKNNEGKQYKSILYPWILGLVNCADFPYDFGTVWNLPISVFMKSVEQIQKAKNVGYTLQGIYSGCIDAKKLNKDELRWI